MKTIFVFVVGLLVGAGGMYYYVTQTVNIKMQDVVEKILTDVQKSLPEQLGVVPLNADGSVQKEFLNDRYEKQKQDIEEKIEGQKEGIQKDLEETTKWFLHKQIESLFKKDTTGTGETE